MMLLCAQKYPLIILIRIPANVHDDDGDDVQFSGLVHVLASSAHNIQIGPIIRQWKGV